MRTILSAILILLTVSTVQSRTIPLDSIQVYLQESKNEAIKQMVLIRKVGDSLMASGRFDELSIETQVYDELDGAYRVMTHAKTYFALVQDCGMSWTIFDGIYQICSDLGGSIDALGSRISETESPLLALQTKEAMEFLVEYFTDVVDSIPDERCAELIRGGVPLYTAAEWPWPTIFDGK